MIRPYYTACSTFTVVYTPHYQEQCSKRRGSPLTLDMLERMWLVGQEDTTTGFRWRGGYVYYNCEWNSLRDRWELVLITYTPGTRFHTANLTHAVEVHP